MLLLVDIELKNYIETNILPKYKFNDDGHKIDHIEYVLDRSLKFASQVNACEINYNMVYAIATYHDVGHSIDPKNHEKVSADILSLDKNLLRWFTEKEISIMAEAISDHRASGDYEPRSIYGKIVSSADRNTSVESIIKRAYQYRRKLSPTMTMYENAEESYRHIMDKFGPNGYAVEKMYFQDPEYQDFLNKINIILLNKDNFYDAFFSINKLNKSKIRDQIEEYIPFDEQEHSDKRTMMAFLNQFKDVVTRNNVFGHFTASAFVVNESKTDIVLLKHNIFGDCVYPGGHADGEYDLLSVAIREVKEETGLTAEPFNNGDIFSIQCIPVKGHVKNEKYVSPHIHYDVAYLLVVKDDEMDKIRVLESENSDVFWACIEESCLNGMADWFKHVFVKFKKKFNGGYYEGN